MYAFTESYQDEQLKVSIILPLPPPKPQFLFPSLPLQLATANFDKIAALKQYQVQQRWLWTLLPL